jgi:molybdate/tungstate transport system permease protein
MEIATVSQVYFCLSQHQLTQRHPKSSPREVKIIPKTFNAILILAGAIILFLFLYPILLLLGLGVGDIFSALKTGSFLGSVEVTFVIATAAAAFAIIVGTPFAYLLARYDFRFKEIVDVIVDIPIMVPHVIVGVMIVLAFASTAGFGPFFQAIGFNVIDTLLGAIITVTYLSATYSIRIVEGAIRQVNPDVELTARTLGASPQFTFIHVVIPKIWRSIANGAIITWARAVAEVGALLVIAYYVLFNGNLISPASIYIYEGYEALGLENAVKFSAALVVIIMVTFILYRVVLKYAGKKKA